MHLAAAEPGQEARTGPHHWQQQLREGRVRHRTHAPQEEGKKNEPQDLANSGPTQLNVERDFGSQTHEHPDNVERDVQQEQQTKDCNCG